jgi:hypothetical protein
MQKALTGILLLFMISYVHGQSWTAASPNIYFTGGNVGIGNAQPSALLHIGALDGVAGSPYPSSTLLKVYQPFNSTIQSASIDIGLCQPHARITGYGSSTYNASGQMAFSTMRNSVVTEVMRLDALGNVGVGTTTPAYRLDLYTTNTNDGLKVTSSSGRVLLNGNNMSSGAYNGLTQAGDGGLIYGNSSGTTNFGFVIAPWAYSNGGIRMDKNGSVGIGTYNTGDAGYRLFVETGIRTRKITVDQSTWPDYVFHPSYALPSLSSVATYIRDNGHLPDVPSADSVAKNGVDLGNNQAALLRKIEELTLYTIDQQQQVEELKQENKKMQEQMNALLKVVKQLETHKVKP